MSYDQPNDAPPLPSIFALASELGWVRGNTAINELEGCLVLKVDDNWTIAFNAHLEGIEEEPEGCMGCEVPPFTIAIWWNGWIAGFCNANGGALTAHPDGANEDRLIADLEAAIENERRKEIDP